MSKKYTYKLRPLYGSKKLLIEFGYIGENTDTFVLKLLDILTNKGFLITEMADVWVNDEIWYHFSSKNGNCLLTRNNWDMLFIIANDNQKDILLIDKILKKTGLFIKEKVDFSEYKVTSNRHKTS